MTIHRLKARKRGQRDRTASVRCRALLSPRGSSRGATASLAPEPVPRTPPAERSEASPSAWDGDRQEVAARWVRGTGRGQWARPTSPRDSPLPLHRSALQKVPGHPPRCTPEPRTPGGPPSPGECVKLSQFVPQIRREPTTPPHLTTRSFSLATTPKAGIWVGGCSPGLRRESKLSSISHGKSPTPGSLPTRAPQLPTPSELPWQQAALSRLLTGGLTWDRVSRGRRETAARRRDAREARPAAGP